MFLMFLNTFLVIVLAVSVEKCEGSTFKLRGTLSFPTTGVYTDVPAGSCLVLKVTEAIQCDGMNCQPPKVSGETVIRVFDFSANKLTYEFECNNFNPPIYYVSATFNVGWCGKSSADEWIRKGDYKTEYGYQLDNPANNTEYDMSMVIYDSPELCGRYRCDKKHECQKDVEGNGFCQCKDAEDCAPAPLYLPSCESYLKSLALDDASSGMWCGDAMTTFCDSNCKCCEHSNTCNPSPYVFVKTETQCKKGPQTDYSLSGSIRFPEKGLYTKFPLGSCVQIKIHGNARCADDCERPLIYHKRIDKIVVTNKTMNFYINAGQLKSDEYSVTVVLNNGWCQTDGDMERRPKDYHNDVSATFAVNDGDVAGNVDVQITPIGKYYICGEKTCFKNEKCIARKEETYCSCSGYACGDLIKPEWVCANNGKSYVSECWMAATDCFSGTILKVRNGRCDAAVRVGKWFNEKRTAVCGSVGILVVLLLVFFVVVFKKRFHKKKLFMDQTMEKKPSEYATEKQHIDKSEMEVKKVKHENIYVDLPTPEPIYEQPPDYVAVLHFENKSYDA